MGRRGKPSTWLPSQKLAEERRTKERPEHTRKQTKKQARKKKRHEQSIEKTSEGKAKKKARGRTQDAIKKKERVKVVIFSLRALSIPKHRKL